VRHGLASSTCSSRKRPRRPKHKRLLQRTSHREAITETRYVTTELQVISCRIRKHNAPRSEPLRILVGKKRLVNAVGRIVYHIRPQLARAVNGRRTLF